MKIKKILLAVTMALCCAVFSTGCSNKGASGNIGEITFSDGDKIAEITIEHYGTIKAKLFPEIAPIGVENFIQLAEQGYYDGLKIHRVVADFMLQGGSLNGDGTGGNAVYSGENSVATDFEVETSLDARHFYGALCYANALGRNTTQFYIVNNKQPQNLDELDPKNIKASADSYTAALEGLEAGSNEYQQYQYLADYYTKLAEMVEKASDEVKEKYKNGGAFSLDGGYTVFGQVYEGLDVVDAISSCAVEVNSMGENSKPVQDIVISSVKIVTYTTSTAEADNSSSSAPKITTPASSGSDIATEENSSESSSPSTAENSGSSESTKE